MIFLIVKMFPSSSLKCHYLNSLWVEMTGVHRWAGERVRSWSLEQVCPQEAEIGATEIITDYSTNRRKNGQISPPSNNQQLQSQ